MLFNCEPHLLVAGPAEAGEGTQRGLGAEQDRDRKHQPRLGFQSSSDKHRFDRFRHLAVVA